MIIYAIESGKNLIDQKLLKKSLKSNIDCKVKQKRSLHVQYTIMDFGKSDDIKLA